MTSPVHIVFSDLDGTLLGSDRKISRKNISCLEKLGSMGIHRVIATGRSLFSCQKVIFNDFPADFLIFSSGAGIIELKSQRMIFSANLQTQEICSIIDVLSEREVDFMVHQAVPENHHFIYSSSGKNNPDFARRIEIYRDYAIDYQVVQEFPISSAQVIVIFADMFSRFEEIEKELSSFQVIRTTSPLDHTSLWMEIFPLHVSKGKSSAWLCRHLGIDEKKTLGIGNDYNDISLLEFTDTSYVVGNAPAQLQSRYLTTKSNDDGGFAAAITREIHNS